MGSVSKQIKYKASKAHTFKKLTELSTFAGIYASELGDLLVQKGILTEQEEHEVMDAAIKRTQDEIKTMAP